MHSSDFIYYLYVPELEVRDLFPLLETKLKSDFKTVLIHFVMASKSTVRFCASGKGQSQENQGKETVPGDLFLAKIKLPLP